ncbi:nitrogen assimilation transcription factor [Rhizoctonia solani]|uniref:Nitrogen assimilation transcription factor n=1 Tax=Rhizoctonia solani TaxID=456999 RepID=A0A8H7LN11_9AGAM|nr:nitrogen assimilation transcription factor [Rhizoctonia solani]
MSRSEAGPSRRRSKYAPRACNTCRRRKCKCDGDYPICQPCAVAGYECTWTPETEGERPVTKQLVKALRAKTHQLEAEISQLKQADSRIVPSSSSSGAGPDAEFPLVYPQPIALSESLSHVHTSHVPVESRSPHQTNPTTLPSHSSHDQPHPTPHIDLIDSPGNPISECPMTTSALKYQYIFHIDTSLPHNEQSPEHQASLKCEWNRYLPNLDTIQFSRHEHDTLLHRYFSYGAAWLFGMLPDSFLHDMLEYLSPSSTCTPDQLPHYSPILHCSVLAFASSMSENPHVRQPSTREKFATHAKQWLDQEFNRPNPSERNTGYMYTGMSMRAARAGTASQLRSWYCWSAFLTETYVRLSLESFVAQEMRRPSEMPTPNGLVTLPIAYELSAQPLSEMSATHLFDHVDYPRITIECFIKCTSLMLITNTIPTATQLETWFNAFPANLHFHQSDAFTPPPILALHIHYWWSILRLYLPDSATEPNLSMNLALVKLVELFEAFDAQFGLQYFPRNLLKAMYMCGRASILERLPEDGIEICLKGLRVWPCAESMVADLVQLRSSL